MKVVKATLIAGLVLSLPIAMGGQGIVDLGDHGAAFAKNDKSDKGDRGNNGRGSDKSSSDKTKSDKGGRGNSDKANKSDRSGATKSSNGNGPFAKLKERFGNGSSGNTKVAGASGKPAKVVKSSGAPKTSASTLVATSKKPAKRPELAPETVLAGGALASQLKSLNSLNRNINGLMNSSDPKMEPFREFVRASAESEAAQETLEAARLKAGMTQAEYDRIATELTLSEDPQAALTDLDDRLLAHAGREPLAPVPTAEIPEDSEAFASLQLEWELAHMAWEKEGAALADARNTTQTLIDETADVAEAETAATTAAEAVSDEALRKAMIDSLNATGAGPVTEDDITPEMEIWVSDQLGVGEAEGLIDAYIASQPVETTETEDPAEAALDEGEAAEVPDDMEAEADDGTIEEPADDDTPPIITVSAAD